MLHERYHTSGDALATFPFPDDWPQICNGGTALHLAASRGSDAVVALLLSDPRIDPNAVDAVSSPRF